MEPLVLLGTGFENGTGSEFPIARVVGVSFRHAKNVHVDVLSVVSLEDNVDVQMKEPVGLDGDPVAGGLDQLRVQHWPKGSTAKGDNGSAATDDGWRHFKLDRKQFLRLESDRLERCDLFFNRHDCFLDRTKVRVECWCKRVTCVNDNTLEPPCIIFMGQ